MPEKRLHVLREHAHQGFNRVAGGAGRQTHGVNVGLELAQLRASLFRDGLEKGFDQPGALGKVSLQMVFFGRLQRQPVRQKQPGGVKGQIETVSRQGVGGQSVLQPEGLSKSVDGALAGLVHGLKISPA
jgi:hypothetical protein